MGTIILYEKVYDPQKPTIKQELVVVCESLEQIIRELFEIAPPNKMES